MPKLLYQGHGSFRLTANDGRIIYVDPYAGKGYDMSADFILITHGHHDHTKTGICAKKSSCRIITHEEALAGGKHNSFDLDGIIVTAVEAGNKNHDPKECVGYLVTIDGVKIYASGDTSKTKQMEEFAALNLDYAILCGDGFFNMGPAEAAECAKTIRAKHNILIHMKPGALFSPRKAEKWQASDKLIIRPNEEVVL